MRPRAHTLRMLRAACTVWRFVVGPADLTCHGGNNGFPSRSLLPASPVCRGRKKSAKAKLMRDVRQVLVGLPDKVSCRFDGAPRCMLWCVFATARTHVSALA